eukprot:UN10482
MHFSRNVKVSKSDGFLKSSYAFLLKKVTIFCARD